MNHQLEINLRNWVKADFPSVRNILEITWKDTYNFIPENDLLLHLENYYSESKLNELFDNPAVIGILAEFSSKPIGWMKLFDDQLTSRFYISSLYVLPSYQGFGMGKRLLQKAEEIAAKLGYTKVWLGVMNDNVKALEWYKKNGFNFTEQEPFKMGQTEVLHLIGYKIIAHK
ncbi:MAG: GNAT family N-acetyltransferase [Ignavibacteriaceae bacterium]|nr:GNAT family N-acetyltransferase [Ignavibacteriaceae bacterium]